jgi:transmembrane sensor
MQSGEDQTPRSVQLLANQQVRVTAADWPPTPTTVDAQHATAWLHRQIVFDQEPLERVAAEFNRYSPTPIEIVTPTLRDLQISGVFATDDTEAFIAFLRSLKGVRVEVTATRIRVSRSAGIAPRNYT